MYYLIFKAAFIFLYYNFDLLVLILKLKLIKGSIIIMILRDLFPIADKKKIFIKFK